ncbi:HlyD family secretion protein [Thiomicrorhabdus hydrogeniphila]
MNWLKKILILIILIALGLAVFFWWQYQARYPSTDDAYVDANRVYISPQVQGAIQQVKVKPFEQVTKGQLLLRIDPDQFNLDLHQAQAQLSLAQTQAVSAKAEINNVQSQQKELQSEYDYLSIDNKRIKTMTQKGLSSQQAEDESRYKLKEAKSKLEAAESTIKASKAKLAEAQAQITSANVAVNLAKLNLQRTYITAPNNGVLGDFNIQPGQYVNTGEKLFPMIQDDNYWLIANFKETDLPRIKDGQPAKIVLDLAPNLVLTGKVESISPASGSAFSMIPSQNATGNWVKVTQRFPIRIHIDLPKNDDQALHALRVGASATITLDTQSKAN